ARHTQQAIRSAAQAGGFEHQVTDGHEDAGDGAASTTHRQGRRGIIFVMTGASGVGKDSIRRVAMPQLGPIFFSVSATTRKRRAGEIHGGHYLFVERAQFEQMLADDQLLEHADYVGDYYGSPLAPVED